MGRKSGGITGKTVRNIHEGAMPDFKNPCTSL